MGRMLVKSQLLSDRARGPLDGSFSTLEGLVELYRLKAPAPEMAGISLLPPSRGFCVLGTNREHVGCIGR